MNPPTATSFLSFAELVIYLTHTNNLCKNPRLHSPAFLQESTQHSKDVDSCVTVQTNYVAFSIEHHLVCSRLTKEALDKHNFNQNHCLGIKGGLQLFSKCRKTHTL